MMKSDLAAAAEAKKQGDCRAGIAEFIGHVQHLAGHRIHEATIWKLARYKSDTQWKRWKSGKLSLDSAAAKTFAQILAMPPTEFIKNLNKQNAKTNLSTFF